MLMAHPLVRPLLATPPSPANPASSFGSILARLNSVIAEETAMLCQRQAGELQAFTTKKNQLLFELSRALKTTPVEDIQRNYGPQLKELRWRLDANKNLLGTHLEAAREVSQTIIEAIRQADSDGTYVPSIRSGGPPK
jgi:flagellar biosynthesis/type III secretory pathway chaperone